MTLQQRLQNLHQQHLRQIWTERLPDVRERLEAATEQDRLRVFNQAVRETVEAAAAEMWPPPFEGVQPD